MSTETVRLELPEEREIARLKAQLEELQAELGAVELELASLKNQLAEFEGRYYRIVGVKFAELDELNARLAEMRAAQNPSVEAQEEAAEARRQAQESQEEVGQKQGEESGSEFAPSADTKALFRSIASKVHPDLASDESDRLYRTEFFKSVNAAYREQDHARLADLARQWELRPEAIAGEDIGAQLVRLIRKVAQVSGRLSSARNELSETIGAELNTLRERERELASIGRDLLSEMRLDIENQIAEFGAEALLPEGRV